VTSKNLLDFGGAPDHVGLGLGLRLQLPWERFVPPTVLYKLSYLHYITLRYCRVADGVCLPKCQPSFTATRRQYSGVVSASASTIQTADDSAQQRSALHMSV